MLKTGPTAHLPPIYPGIFALIYQIFGLTEQAGLVSMLFIAVSAALLYASMPWLSKQLGTGNPAGFIGGLAAALWIEWPGHGEYPTALVMALLLVWFLRRWTIRRATLGGSFLLGIAIGISLHIQPALLPVLLGCMGFELWWSDQSRKSSLIGVMTIGLVMACLPWAWRNYATFDSFVFIRSNLGLELRMGNHEGAAAAMAVMDEHEERHLHPRTHFTEARTVQEMGEIEFMRQARQDAFTWIRDNPKDFVFLTVQRIGYFWAGPWYDPGNGLAVLLVTILAAAGMWLNYCELTIPQRAAFLIPLATFPLIYYIVAYMPRYRVPIDWILFILAGAGVWQAIGRITKSRHI